MPLKMAWQGGFHDLEPNIQDTKNGMVPILICLRPSCGLQPVAKRINSRRFSGQAAQSLIRCGRRPCHPFKRSRLIGKKSASLSMMCPHRVRTAASQTLVLRRNN